MEESVLRVIQDEESDDTFFVDGYDEIGKRVSVKAVLSGDSKSYHVTGKYGDEDKRIDQVVNLPAYLDKAVDSEESVKEAVLAAIAFSEDAGEIAPE